METTQLRVTASGRIHLHLPNEPHKPVREIGWFDGDTYHCERNPEKHFHHVTNSVGFNYELMRDGRFSRVVVHLPFGEQLETTRKHILERGFFLYFKQKGFEKQRFLSLGEFGLDKANETEIWLKEQQPKENQQNLLDEVA